MGKRIFIMRHSIREDGGMLPESDCSLSAEGFALATRTGQMLAAKIGCFDMIFASPYKRTQQTSKLVRDKLQCTEDKKCEIKTRLELAETHTMHHNNWKNTKIPPALTQLLADAGIHQPEPDSHVEARCLSLIKELVQDANLGDVLLVSHAGLILEFVSLLCAPNKPPPLKVSYCDVYCFERNDDLQTWHLVNF